MWENTMFGTETFGRPRKWSPGHGFGREFRYTLSFFTEIPKIAVPRPISAFPGPKIKLCIFSSSCSPGPDFSSAWTLPRPEIFLSCVRLLRKSQTLWEICVFLSGWGGGVCVCVYIYKTDKTHTNCQTRDPEGGGGGKRVVRRAAEGAGRNESGGGLGG